MTAVRPRSDLRVGVILAAILTMGFASARAEAEGILRADARRQWYKGNLHAHTLWSDGDAAPERVIGWYRCSGYHFLSLTPHNGILDGEQWVKISKGGPLTEVRVRRIAKRYGEDSIERRQTLFGAKMRLKTFEDLKEMFEEPGAFVLLPGQEITPRSNVHMNIINLREEVPVPRSLKGAVETIRMGLNAAQEQRRRFGIPVLAQINHPNLDFGNGRAYIRASDIAAFPEANFFEVYNGFAAARNEGDSAAGIDSTELIWDRVLTRRATEESGIPLYGLANDDAHDYFDYDPKASNPGRGWNMVLAEGLTANSLLDALGRGDFYASTGIELTEIAWEKDRLRISIEAEPGAEYLTQFIGTKRQVLRASSFGAEASGEEEKLRSDSGVGAVLYETKSNPAVYRFTGDELYVRARVTSSQVQKNSLTAGARERCWTQPIFLR